MPIADKELISGVNLS